MEVVCSGLEVSTNFTILLQGIPATEGTTAGTHLPNMIREIRRDDLLSLHLRWTQNGSMKLVGT